MVRVLFSGLEELPLARADALLFQRHIRMQLELIDGLFNDFSVCYVTFSKRSTHTIIDIVLVHSGGAVYGHGDNANYKLAGEHAVAQVRANMRRKLHKFDQAELQPY